MRRAAGQLLSHEVCRSIPGESTFVGLPCVFVRLTACAACCVWCDVPHAFNFEPSDQIKFVIASERDFDWTEETIRSRNLDRRFTVPVSAVFDSVTPPELANWLHQSALQVRLQLQLHKHIWNPLARGV